MDTLQPSSSFPPNLLHGQFLRTPMLGKTRVQRALKKKKKLQERNKIPRTEALKQHKQAIKDQSEQVLFTIAYNLASPNIQDILRKKKRILYSTQRLKKKIYKEVPVVAFRRSPYLRDLLVRPKLANTGNSPKTPAGTFCCNSKHRCLTCPFIDNGRTSYTFINAAETRNTRHHVTLRP